MEYTDKQKLKLVMGKDCWHTEDFDGQAYAAKVSDGPIGLRTPKMIDGVFKDEPSVAYPSMQILSHSWNEQLAYKLGEALASDAAERGVDVLLAPGLNIKRSPHCGRNFEYVSEDPLLAGRMGKMYVKGLQDNHVGATLKHFCCNNAEFSRMWLSAEVDERTLREIYTRAFEIALEAQPWAVMCSYNVVNGVRAAQNRKLFTLLRKDLGFGNGLIMSDWGAVTDAAASVNAGLDLIMPYAEKCEQRLEQAYDNGDLDRDALNESAQRVDDFAEKCRAESKQRKVTMSIEERMNLARKIEEQGIVLLKNNGVLPLSPNANVSVGGYPESYFAGGGSSAVPPLNTPLGLLTALGNAMPDGKITYRDLWEYGVSEAPLHQIEDAYGKDAAVLCMGMHDCEGFDRNTMQLTPPQVRQIKETARKNPNTVVVLYCGAPIDMSGWINDVAAVVWAGYPGEQGNLAVADVLCGKVNPSGKLTETFPATEFDYPAHRCYMDSTVSVYSDGLLVGYRYHTTAAHKNLPTEPVAKPLFPFGYGLSYTSYRYSDAQAAVTDKGVEVSFDISNTGRADGTEIAQLYVREVNPRVFRPFMELAGFERVDVPCGSTKRVTVTLPLKNFAYYSVCEGRWLVEGGEYEVYIGTNSQDTPLCVTVRLPRC